MTAKLYVVPASHPCATVERALQLKGVPYRTVNLVPVYHKAHQKLRFGGSTVPGLILDDGRKVHGSLAILRALETVQPDPALFPPDPDARRRVEEAEAWGDAVLQPLVRRIVWLALSRDPAAQLTYAESLSLFPPTPRPVARLAAGTVAWAERRINASTEDAVRADLAALPGHLDRIDGWLEDGLLGGEPPNAADLQVGSGLRLLQTLEDLAPLIDRRPAGEHARRVFPDYPGRVGSGALPSGWLPVPSVA